MEAVPGRQTKTQSQHSPPRHRRRSGGAEDIRWQSEQVSMTTRPPYLQESQDNCLDDPSMRRCCLHQAMPTKSLTPNLAMTRLACLCQPIRGCDRQEVVRAARRFGRKPARRCFSPAMCIPLHQHSISSSLECRQRECVMTGAVPTPTIEYSCVP